MRLNPGIELLVCNIETLEAIQIAQFFPEIQWREFERAPDGVALVHPCGLRAIVSCTQYRDRTIWLHVSFSRHDRMPSYEDMVLVKKDLIGAAKKAVMVLPSEAEHYNCHPYCLHLYSRIDGDSLPDFRDRDGRI